ncbi:hypothetical protein [Lacinutrix sp. 5H-3-7-4]|uniref:hypothetical protein n=1 Tax=Lacinutrix sp. (strain 5H-3-7-4) TaxID=983544 RepID=UPI00020A395F|nr:hypothetical protein [Lacinutrix sp. 5H-3-7-4]AEH00432.1 hypothetical protein Lacal_0581 [Lacinutrix sp. 5H-3-7-4]
MESKFRELNKLFDDYVNNYIREYGERNSGKIINTIKTSKHTSNLINQSASKRVIPSANDFKSTTLGNLSLSFARTAKVRFATLILLYIWHNEVQIPLNLGSEADTISLLNRILNTTN